MRLIDAEKLKERMCRQCNVECGDDPCEPDECFVRTVILDAPAIDAVEVVRCKDCKHITPVEGGVPLCTMHDRACGNYEFCIYGERKDE